MQPKIKDDRNEVERVTHPYAVVAKDSAMSHWGLSNGVSRVAWACASWKEAEKAFDWVKSRDEMKYVQLVDLRSYRPPRTDGHFHVYIVRNGHPALDEE